MRILFVVHGFPPQATGGVELRAYYLAQEFRRNHTVSVFCRGASPELEDYHRESLEIDGIPTRRINYNFRDLDTFVGVYLNSRMEAEFESYLDEFQPEIVHIHHLTCLSTRIPEILRRRGIPQILSLHDFWMGCPKGQRIRSDLQTCGTIDRELCLPCAAEIWGPLVEAEPIEGFWRRLLKRFDPLARLKEYERHIQRVLDIPDLLLTPSEFSRSIFLGQGVAPERIRALPYGLDKSIFEGVGSRPSETFRFAFVGSVLPTKGVHVLLEAFRGLERDGVRLDIYGEIVPFHGNTTYVEELGAEIEATEGVTLHGRYENSKLPRILENVDALVVPGVWFETFCITIREGFLADVPVIASNLGAMGESLEDGVSGLLFHPGDSRDLRRQMRRLVDEPDLRVRLRGQSERVKGIRENSEELLELYRQVRGAPRQV